MRSRVRSASQNEVIKQETVSSANEISDAPRKHHTVLIVTISAAATLLVGIGLATGMIANLFSGISMEAEAEEASASNQGASFEGTIANVSRPDSDTHYANLSNASDGEINLHQNVKNENKDAKDDAKETKEKEQVSGGTNSVRNEAQATPSSSTNNGGASSASPATATTDSTQRTDAAGSTSPSEPAASTTPDQTPSTSAPVAAEPEPEPEPVVTEPEPVVVEPEPVETTNDNTYYEPYIVDGTNPYWYLFAPDPADGSAPEGWVRVDTGY